MKRTLFALIALSLLPNIASAQPLEWSGVRAVGGLKIGLPYLQQGEWYMPVKADVSGVNGGTTVNSGLACDVSVRLDKGKVLVTLNTELAGSMGNKGSAKCTPVRLGPVKGGSYEVIYRSPSESDQTLGDITLTEKTSRPAELGT